MIQKLFFLPLLLVVLHTQAQRLSQKVADAFQRFEQDSQLQNGLASLYIEDDNGNVLFQKNSTIGLAPASTQKIITSATAYALLGTAFTYKTIFGLLLNDDGSNSLYIRGSGDPTLGSWRWKDTKDTEIMRSLIQALGDTKLNATVYVDTSGWDSERIPGGWIWEDIGNYYGAGAGVFNWHENQYDIILHSGATVGSAVRIMGTRPQFRDSLSSKVTAAAAGSGDNAYVYFSPGRSGAVVRGTIPVNEKAFLISAAIPQPARLFVETLFQQLKAPRSQLDSIRIIYTGSVAARKVYTLTSPPLDSLVYWFNRKSINLYGEALLKTIAYQKKGRGDTEVGMGVLKSFWQERGIAPTALNLVDGSGLSPLNRLTTQTQVAVLQYARRQPWFAGFYKALPEYNGMKLKSGTINGVKGFAGYHTSRTGQSYAISFLVNNYNGAESLLVKKMFAVLDVLK